MRTGSLGRGPAFPFAPSAGAIALRDGADKVRESIRIILDTEPGERVMRPGFGCGLRRYLMHPNVEATRALIKHDVERALAAFEPRIELRSIDVLPDPAEPSRVDIVIAYVHARDHRPGNLVYPFYLE